MTLYVIPIEFWIPHNVWISLYWFQQNHFSVVDTESLLLLNAFRRIIIFLGSHYFLVNNDCGSCFSVVYCDWRSYHFWEWIHCHSKTRSYSHCFIVFMFVYHVHCNLGEFRSAYFDLNLKQSGAYKTKYNTKKQAEKKKLFMVPLVRNYFIQRIL